MTFCQDLMDLHQTWHGYSLWRVDELIRHWRSWGQRSRSLQVIYKNFVCTISHMGFDGCSLGLKRYTRVSIHIDTKDRRYVSVHMLMCIVYRSWTFSKLGIENRTTIKEVMAIFLTHVPRFFNNFANARSNIVIFLQKIHYLKVFIDTFLLNKHKKATKQVVFWCHFINFKQIWRNLSYDFPFWKMYRIAYRIVTSVSFCVSYRSFLYCFSPIEYIWKTLLLKMNFELVQSEFEVPMGSKITKYMLLGPILRQMLWLRCGILCELGELWIEIRWTHSKS